MSMTSDTSFMLWRSAAAAQHPETLFAEPLEAVRRAARLERAAAENFGARRACTAAAVASTCSSVSAEQGRP